MMFKCRVNVADGVPKFIQHWDNVSFLAGGICIETALSCYADFICVIFTLEGRDQKFAIISRPI